jgi:hypothetical protein
MAEGLLYREKKIQFNRYSISFVNILEKRRFLMVTGYSGNIIWIK